MPRYHVKRRGPRFLLASRTVTHERSGLAGTATGCSGCELLAIAERLDAELLLDLQGLQLGRLLVHVGVDELADAAIDRVHQALTRRSSASRCADLSAPRLVAAVVISSMAASAPLDVAVELRQVGGAVGQGRDVERRRSNVPAACEDAGVAARFASRMPCLRRWQRLPRRRTA